MGIGASIFLIAVGAILTFAVRNTEIIGAWLDVNAAGWVLMVAGALGLIVSLIIWGSRRRVVEPPVETRERRVVDDDRI